MIASHFMDELRLTLVPTDFLFRDAGRFPNLSWLFWPVWKFVKELHANALADPQRRQVGVEVDDTLQRADVQEGRRVGENRAALRKPRGDADHAALPGRAGRSGIVFDLRTLADGHLVGDLLI